MSVKVACELHPPGCHFVANSWKVIVENGVVRHFIFPGHFKRCEQHTRVTAIEQRCSDDNDNLLIAIMLANITLSCSENAILISCWFPCALHAEKFENVLVSGLPFGRPYLKTGLLFLSFR